MSSVKITILSYRSLQTFIVVAFAVSSLTANPITPKATVRPALDFSDYDQVGDQLSSTYVSQQSDLQAIVNDLLSDGNVGNSTLEYYQLAADYYSRYLDSMLEFCHNVLKHLFKVVKRIADVEDHEGSKANINRIKGVFQDDIVLMKQSLLSIPQQSLQLFNKATIECRGVFICEKVAGDAGQNVKELPSSIRKRFWNSLSVASEKQLAIVTSYFGIVEGYNDNRDDFIDDHLPDYLFEKKTPPIFN